MAYLGKFCEADTLQLSVVIPIHNAERYIRECLDSVLANGADSTNTSPEAAESKVRLEILCVDDCSTDSTPEILQEYERRFPNITVIRNEKNLFAGVSRNAGLALARGKYVHFLDADDMVYPDAYQTLIDFAEKERLDIVKATAQAVDEQNGGEVANDRYAMRHLRPELLDGFLDFYREPEEFMDHMSLVPWNSLYRREFLVQEETRFNSLYCVNDRSFFVETCMKAGRIRVCRTLLVKHRVNVGGSLVKGRSSHFECQFASYRLMKQLCDENGVSEAVRFAVLDAELCDLFVWYGRFSPEIRKRWKRDLKHFLKEEVDRKWFADTGESRWIPRYEKIRKEEKHAACHNLRNLRFTSLWPH